MYVEISVPNTWKALNTNLMATYTRYLLRVNLGEMKRISSKSKSGYLETCLDCTVDSSGWVLVRKLYQGQRNCNAIVVFFLALLPIVDNSLCVYS